MEHAAWGGEQLPAGNWQLAEKRYPAHRIIAARRELPAVSCKLAPEF